MLHTSRPEEVRFFISVVVALLLGLVFWAVRFPPTVPGVRAVLERGYNVLVVRFPESPHERREELIINDSPDETPFVSRSVVTTGEQPFRGTVTSLTAEQHVAWTQVRNDMCQQPPITPEPVSPVFEVAIRCPLPDGTFGRVIQFRIAAPDLPAVLRELMRTVPSPSCTDPMCGW